MLVIGPGAMDTGLDLWLGVVSNCGGTGSVTVLSWVESNYLAPSLGIYICIFRFPRIMGHS